MFTTATIAKNRNRPLLVAALVLAAGAGGCTTKTKTTTTATRPGNSAPAATPVAERPVEAPTMPPRPPVVVGMDDPFVRMNTTALRTLDAGWKAMKRKQYPEARTAFEAVVKAYPDKPAARFAEVRAAILAGDHAAVPALWRQLLARDFVGYAGRLERGKETAALRAGPHWAEVQGVEGEMAVLYPSGLGRGFFFVARTHLNAPPTFSQEPGAPGEGNVTLNQEVYHFDPTTRKIRRISDTGGRVVAVHRDGQKHQQLMLLLARTVKKVEGANAMAFARPEAALVSLDTLVTSAALPIEADAVAVDLCYSPRGEPTWTVSTPGSVEGRALTVDATGAALVPVEEPCGSTVATTIVEPRGVEHRRAEPDGVSLSGDGLALTGVDGDRPLRAKQPIRPGSFAWSPGKKRFVYTGIVGRCPEAEPTPPETGGLFVWDAEEKKSARVKAASGSHEAQWVDDDHLAYESGTSHAPKLTVHDFSEGGESVVVKAPAGAGLFGLPAFPCDQPVTHALVF
jgi:hypothetical protein